jgi:hypothetical protein
MVVMAERDEILDPEFVRLRPRILDEVVGENVMGFEGFP